MARIWIAVTTTVAVVASSVIMTAPITSAAVAGSLSEFPIATPNSKPLGMTTGPDGNLWFTETATAKVGKMTTNGTLLAEYQLPGDHPYPVGLVTGADGNLWIADAGESRIGRMTTKGVFTGFTVPSAEPAGIAAGPDGNIWFTDVTGNRLGKMSTSGVLLAQYPISSPAMEVVAGPDGNMWFTEAANNSIAKMSVSGTVIGRYTPPTSGSKPAGIIAGVDGNMWFTQEDSNQIAKSTLNGTITEYTIPTAASEPSRIVAGSDGNMWFTALAANNVVRVKPNGAMTEYPLSTPNSEPGGTTPGPDGNIWFTMSLANKIGRVAVGPPTPAITGRNLYKARVNASVFPGGAGVKSVIQCARNASFTSGLVQSTPSVGSPSSSKSGVWVRGWCRGLKANTRYYARVVSVYSAPAVGEAPINTMFSTTTQFRTKAQQRPLRNCVMVPPKTGAKAIKPNSTKRLTKRNCKTNAGKRIVVRGKSALRGEIRMPRVFYKGGSWWLRTYSAPARNRLTWSAPATGNYVKYSKTVTRRT